jgi:Ca2+-binding EF-hand superfamily protein
MIFCDDHSNRLEEEERKEVALLAAEEQKRLALLSKPETPRLQYSREQTKKIDRAVKVMMDFTHEDMDGIRQQLMKLYDYHTTLTAPTYNRYANMVNCYSNSRVDMYDFVKMAQSERCSRDPRGNVGEVEALCEMFREIDVNQDGVMSYYEFTSYLVELANTRYDKHHIGMCSIIDAFYLISILIDVAWDL